MKVDPKEVPVSTLHGYLLGAVAPRPIAFASTIDSAGNINLSPFSFFNAFSANPPVLIFSPARRVRDNTIKHTLENVLEHQEVVVNVVSYDMVEQMSLASTEYDKGINEFTKSGLEAVPSELVKPPRVAASPVAFECRVEDIIQLGREGGAGNLVICEVLLIHVNDEILDEHGKIDPRKLDVVGRMGGNWYCRAQGDALFEVAKPILKKGIGVDELPLSVRNSEVLTGNHLGKLGNIEKIPDSQEVELIKNDTEIRDIYQRFYHDKESFTRNLHMLAKSYLDQGLIEKAWKVLLLPEE